MYMWAAARGSMTISASNGPSGVPASGGAHFGNIGFSFHPATPSQVAPPSGLRNKPGGDVPAHQTPGSLRCPGVSQNVWLTARPCCPSGTLGNAGGRDASFQVWPRLDEWNTVG